MSHWTRWWCFNKHCNRTSKKTNWNGKSNEICSYCWSKIISIWKNKKKFTWFCFNYNKGNYLVFFLLKYFFFLKLFFLTNFIILLLFSLTIFLISILCSIFSRVFLLLFSKDISYSVPAKIDHLKFILFYIFSLNIWDLLKII